MNFEQLTLLRLLFIVDYTFRLKKGCELNFYDTILSPNLKEICFSKFLINVNTLILEQIIKMPKFPVGLKILFACE